MPVKSKSRIYPSMKAAATGMGISESVVRKAKANGCAAFRANGNVHEDDLKSWIAEQPAKKLPSDTDTPITPSVMGKTGAGEALKRLEIAEAAAHFEYITAGADPDADETEIAGKLKAWQTIVSALLSYETKVESGKRDAGQLIPKAEVVENAKALLVWTHAAISDVLHNCTPRMVGCKTARDAAAIIDPAMREALPIALGYAQRANKLPAWLAEAALQAAPGCDGHELTILEGSARRLSLTKEEKAMLAKIIKRLRK